MCKPDTVSSSSSSSSPPPSLAKCSSSISSASDVSVYEKTLEQQPAFQLLLSLNSYEVDKHGNGPNLSSVVVTMSAIVGFLLVMELLCRSFFLSHKDFHPLLENEINRFILSRHLGVDVLSCFICSLLAWKDRHIVQDCYVSLFGTKNGTIQPCHPAAYDKRLYTYHPAAYRLSLFFFAYQVKNLHDTIVWNDGPEFIFHHVFSMVTALAALKGYVCHYYAMFYFGLSEVSTAVLCLLANFDDVHGVPGLADAFPIPKVIVGAVFVALFVLCRSIMWPVTSVRFGNDVLTELKKTDDPRTIRSKSWLIMLLVTCSAMSVLQVAWLGQIFIIAKEEFQKVGLI